MSKSIKNFNPGDRNQVRKIIEECDSWDGYHGTNVDGDEVWLFVQKDQGLVIKTKHAAKPKWWECVSYDADGDPEGVTYEPTAELEETMEDIKRRRVS